MPTAVAAKTTERVSTIAVANPPTVPPSLAATRSHPVSVTLGLRPGACGSGGGDSLGVNTSGQHKRYGVVDSGGSLRWIRTSDVSARAAAETLDSRAARATGRGSTTAPYAPTHAPRSTS